MVDPIVRIHPNTFNKIKVHAWYTAVDTLKEDILTLTAEHIHYRMMKLIEILSGNHTQYRFNDSSLLYLLHLDYFGDKFRVFVTAP